MIFIQIRTIFANVISKPNVASKYSKIAAKASIRLRESIQRLSQKNKIFLKSWLNSMINRASSDFIRENITLITRKRTIKMIVSYCKISINAKIVLRGRQRKIAREREPG
jgi:predicted thioredoxin/glutaredoxin